MNMNLLIVISVVILLSRTVFTQNCASSIFPPDWKSGCCGRSADGDKISGSIARLGEYPWMSSVEYQKKDKMVLLCGATLISGRYVLSAAQCFSEAAFRVATPKNVRLGDYDVNNDGPDCVETAAGEQDCTDGAISIPIEKFTVHPEYNSVKNHRWNDIALIRLARMAPYTDFIRPICLPSLDITVKAPKNLYMAIAGWGAVNKTLSKSNVLRRIHVPYVDFYLCRHIYNETLRTAVVLFEGQLCAGSKNRDACTGDSGGPLMLLKGDTLEIAGIVSFGPHPCGQDIPGVYTKVYAYKDWINATIEADELTSTTTQTSASTTHDMYSDFIVFKE